MTIGVSHRLAAVWQSRTSQLPRCVFGCVARESGITSREVSLMSSARLSSTRVSPNCLAMYVVRARCEYAFSVSGHQSLMRCRSLRASANKRTANRSLRGTKLFVGVVRGSSSHQHTASKSLRQVLMNEPVVVSMVLFAERGNTGHYNLSDDPVSPTCKIYRLGPAEWQ